MPFLVLSISYLFGCFPTAYLAGRFLRGKDIRELGDGNIGAGNAYRELGSHVGISVFVIDLTKGMLVIALSRVLDSS